ncbi:hypothetical protein GA0115241_1085234 [Streptomyces sp. DpondAA-D4]|nr:hypothetical protein GA0115241_1085234 [Streptomyces sp. DpondAA-D4]SCE28810.1 hypothetical protein GA0115249_117136 [Streptomyces sp. PpalLS-921]
MESEERTDSETSTPAISLLEGLSEPSPEPGCRACLSLSVSRENARSTGNHSGVSDCDVRLRRHQVEAHA